MIERVEKLLKLGGMKRDITFLAISGIALVISLFSYKEFAYVAIVLCGIPIILEAIIGLVTAFDITADVLVSIALIASVSIGEIFAAGEVAFIMQLGGLLEDLTVRNARSGIEKLVHLTPLTARLIKADKETIIDCQEVKIGDVLRVLPGESVPVDGRIIKGKTSINQAVMTGESLPVDKSEGDEVSSGTVNMYGAFDMVATKVGKDSSIQRMVKLVQSADASKAKVVSMADRWATWIVVIALSASIITYFVTHQIIRSVTILVVFCPCSLVLATPTAIMAAIGNATRHGFLVSVGDALERLAKVSVVTFDKTGTLTYGHLEVKEIVSVNDNYSKQLLFKYVASLESLSQHPIGQAIVASYNKQGDSLFEVTDFMTLPGIGLKGKINGKKIMAGNERISENKQIGLPSINKSYTTIYLLIDDEYIGYLLLSDIVRKESPSMISEMKDLKVTSVLLSGDNKAAASLIGNDLNIDEIYWQCLPEDKMRIIKHYQDHSQVVCMIGDGINDAPALKTADIGIAMGGIGSDMTVEAADIVLVDDNIGELPYLISLSKRMMNKIKVDITFSMTLNFIAIILAMTGVLGPVVGALVHNAGSVFVIVNASLLLMEKKK